MINPVTSRTPTAATNVTKKRNHQYQEYLERRSQELEFPLLCNVIESALELLSKDESLFSSEDVAAKGENKDLETSGGRGMQNDDEKDFAVDCLQNFVHACKHFVQRHARSVLVTGTKNGDVAKLNNNILDSASFLRSMHCCVWSNHSLNFALLVPLEHCSLTQMSFLDLCHIDRHQEWTSPVLNMLEIISSRAFSSSTASCRG